VISWRADSASWDGSSYNILTTRFRWTNRQLESYLFSASALLPVGSFVSCRIVAAKVTVHSIGKDGSLSEKLQAIMTAAKAPTRPPPAPACQSSANRWATHQRPPQQSGATRAVPREITEFSTGSAISRSPAAFVVL